MHNYLAKLQDTELEFLAKNMKRTHFWNSLSKINEALQILSFWVPYLLQFLTRGSAVAQW